MTQPLVSSEQDYSFEAFARHDFYQAVNRHLVDTVLDLCQQSAGRIRHVLDLACGTGAVTRLLVDGIASRGMQAEVIGLDLSEVALEKARRIVGNGARFITGAAESFAASVPRLDMVVFCNAIHLLEQKDAVVAQAREALNIDGLFAFNTTFFDGAYTPGTERFYKLWMLRALQRLKREHPNLKLDKTRAEAMHWLSPDDYRTLLERNGFVVECMEAEEVQVSIDGWLDISHYSMFAEGALPGIPIEIGAAVLKDAVLQALKELHAEFIPRTWLQVVARTA